MSTTTAQEVRAAADALVAAFAEGRLDDYFGAFAPDATFVFHTTPGRLGSTAEYRDLWRRWVEQDGFRVLGCTSSAQLVQPFGDTAVFSHDVETRVATNAERGDGARAGDHRLRPLRGRRLARRTRAPVPPYHRLTRRDVP